MISDENLGKLSYEIDDIVHKLCIEYKVSPLMLSSVILARLSHINAASQSMVDYQKLLLSVSEMDFTELADKQPATPQVH